MNAPFKPPSVDKITDRLKEFLAAKNIAALLDKDKLGEIGSKVCDEYELDLQSNAEWRKTAEKALDIALQAPEVKNYPFPNAANVKYPLVTVAALQFNARAYPAIVDGQGIVKAKVIGSDEGVPKTGPDGQPVIDPATAQSGDPKPVWEVPPGAKRAKADRISRHMSYQLSEEMEEWEEDTDTLLMQIPIVGTAFRKVYYDPVLRRNKSEMVSGLDYVVHRKTQSLESVPRGTHRLWFYPLEIENKQRSGIWQDDFSAGVSSTDSYDGDEDAPHEFLEQHRLIDLDGDGYREPYIVTVHKESEEVVRIVANYGLKEIEMGPDGVRRIQRRDFFVKYGFIPDPKGGFYDIGFGRLLQSLNAAIDTSINQMLDAGHLQTAGGGFVGSGVRLKKSTVTLEPGVYKTVDAPGVVLRDAFFHLQHPGPSDVLFSLLGMLIDAAKDITAVQDILTGDTKDRNQTATTTLALIEQGMKVFTAIYKRIYRSLKREFKLLYRLNAENLPQEAYFTVLDQQEAIAAKDYQTDDYDVCPQADPRLVTDMQRISRAQVLMETLPVNPEAKREILEEFYSAVGVEDVKRFLKEPPPPSPLAMEAAKAELRESGAKAAKDEATAAKTMSEIEQGGKKTQIDAAKLVQQAEQFERKQALDERQQIIDVAASRERIAESRGEARQQ